MQYLVDSQTENVFKRNILLMAAKCICRTVDSCFKSSAKGMLSQAEIVLEEGCGKVLCTNNKNIFFFTEVVYTVCAFLHHILYFFKKQSPTIHNLKNNF